MLLVTVVINVAIVETAGLPAVMVNRHLSVAMETTHLIVVMATALIPVFMMIGRLHDVV
jgi:hypothetical protein